jgi:hypothetical protein
MADIEGIWPFQKAVATDRCTTTLLKHGCEARSGAVKVHGCRSVSGTTQSSAKSTSTAADVTPDVEQRQNSLVLVYRTGGNMEEKCNLRWRKDEIAGAVAGALMLNQNGCIFRHESPIKPARILQPDLGRSSGLPMGVDRLRLVALFRNAAPAIQFRTGAIFPKGVHVRFHFPSRPYRFCNFSS